MSDKSKSRHYSVVPTRDGWEIRRAGAGRAAGVYGTQAEATRVAQEKLRAKGGELRVQGRDGRWRESYTIGRDSLEKLNSVEGIHLSRETRGALKEFEKRRMTGGQRRKEIAEKFSKE